MRYKFDQEPSLRTCNPANHGMVQTQVAAQGWLGSTPGGRRPQVRGWRVGGSPALAGSTPATPIVATVANSTVRNR